MSDTSTGHLLNGRVIYRQFRTGHRSGFEPVLLAAAVPARPGEHVLEAGTGAGAGLLCLAARVGGATGIGLEIDENLARLAEENFQANNLSGVIACQSDVSAYCPGPVFDHAFANPPWHDAAGTASPDGQRVLAHQARHGLLAGWIAAMAAALKPAGSLSLILPAASWPAASAALTAAGLPAVTLFPLWPRLGRPAGQIILQARRRGTACRIHPGLLLHDDEGLTKEAEAVLRDAAPLW